MVNLDEDFKRYMTRLGREEGRAEGREEGRAEERSATIAILANSIIRSMEQDSLSFDKSFDRIGFPEEYRQEVRAAVESRGA
jgi:predicted transposase YdaD